MANSFDLTEDQAREEIVKWGKELFDRGLTNGSGGNISIRVNQNIVLATPTGWSLGHLTPQSITKVNMNAEVLEGLKPTKELPMHLMVYKARPDISAMVHTHSIYAVTYASTMKPNQIMAPYVPSLVAKVGMVKLTPFCLPGSDDLGKVVADGIKESQAVLLGNHGVLAVGKNLEAAVTVAFEVEDNARIYFISGGKARALPEEILSRIKATYK